MRVVVDGFVRSGRAVDLANFELAPAAVVRAVRGDGDELVVDCERPGPVHEHVGLLRRGISLRLGPALAAAARSRGLTAPQDETLATVRSRLDEFGVESVGLTDARERVAETGDATAVLRERVAELRGRLQAAREAGETAADVESAHRDAARRLSEVETERVAAEQALDRARERARAARDGRERRLELEDRVGNLERAARAHLVDAMGDAFADAVDAVPGDATPGARPAEYDGDALTAALAVARVADVAAPIVLDCRRFDAPAAAANCLNAPVLRL